MEYKQINENSEEGFEDLTFQITKSKRSLFSGYYIECFGKFKDNIVGLSFLIKSNMLGIVNNDVSTLKFYKDGIKIISLGRYSDDFINALSSLYELENVDLKMQKETLIECAALKGNPGNIEKEAVQFKCFLNAHSNTEYYAEFYINFDIQNSIIELKEKDTSYRENIIYTLS